MSIAELKAAVDCLSSAERQVLSAYIALKEGISEEEFVGGLTKKLVWPDLHARLQKIYPQTVRGKQASELVSEGRGD